MKTKRTGLIMLAIPDTDNAFYVDMIKAVQGVARLNNYSIIALISRLKPRLGSVCIKQSEIGRTAAELIFKRLGEKKRGFQRGLFLNPS